MERSHAAKSVAKDTIRSAEKRKTQESDGYDSELIESPTLKRNNSSAPRFADAKYYQCSACLNSSPQFWNVKKHILRNHYAQPETRMREINPDGTVIIRLVEGLGIEYRCEACGKIYHDKYIYKEHCLAKNHPLDKNLAIKQKKIVSPTALEPEASLIDPLPLEAPAHQYPPTQAILQAYPTLATA